MVQVSVAGLHDPLATWQEARDAIATWFREQRADLVVDCHPAAGDEEHAPLVVRLHPASDGMVIAGGAGRSVTAQVRTSQVGPGFHVAVCDALHALAKDCDLAWQRWDPLAPSPDETGYFTSGDPAQVVAAMADWVAAACRELLASARAARTHLGHRLNLRPGHRYPTVEVATPVGPRSLAWVHATAEDPEQGLDALPWPGLGDGGEALLGRALVLLWTEIRWRPPLTDGEAFRMLSAASLLQRAHTLDRRLPYPWAAWRELVGLLGTAGYTVDLDRDLEQRLEKLGQGRAQLGYRRHPVAVDLAGGWEVVVPGDFAEETSPEEGTWRAWDGRRDLRVQTGRIRDPRGAEDTYRRFLPGGTTWLQHASPRVTGRAAFVSRLVEGRTRTHLVALTVGDPTGDSPEVASMVLALDDPGERAWALDVWRSLDRHTPDTLPTTGAGE